MTFVKSVLYLPIRIYKTNGWDMLRKYKKKYRKFVFNNRPYFPALFFTLEVALSSSKMLLMAMVFVGIFYTVR